MKYILNIKTDKTIEFEGHIIPIRLSEIFDDMETAQLYSAIYGVSLAKLKPVRYIAYAVITEAETVEGLETAEPHVWWEAYHYDLKEAQKDLTEHMVIHKSTDGIDFLKITQMYQKHQNYVIDVDY